MSNPVCLANGCSHRGGSLELRQDKWTCPEESCPGNDGARVARKRRARTLEVFDTDSDTSDLDDHPQEPQPKPRKATRSDDYNRARQDLNDSMANSHWHQVGGALMPPGRWQTNIGVNLAAASDVGWLPSTVEPEGVDNMTFKGMTPYVRLGPLEQMQTSLQKAAETLEETRRDANEERRMARLRNYMKRKGATTSGVEECIQYTPYERCAQLEKAAREFERATKLQKLLGDIRDSNRCPICHDTEQTAAVLTPCCHNAICRDCLRQSLDSNRDLDGCPTCPICRHNHHEDPETIAYAATPCHAVDHLRTLLASYDKE